MVATLDKATLVSHWGKQLDMYTESISITIFESKFFTLV